MQLTTVRPLLDFSLAGFRSGNDWDLSLYDLRCQAEPEDGWFLVRCKGNETYAASFQLASADAGRWMLGKIACEQSRVTHKYVYSVYIFGGSKDISAFCPTAADLASTIRSLENLGMESIVSENDLWEQADEDVFSSEGFSERPQDVIFEMMFGGGSWAS